MALFGVRGEGFLAMSETSMASKYFAAIAVVVVLCFTMMCMANLPVEQAFAETASPSASDAANLTAGSADAESASQSAEQKKADAIQKKLAKLNLKVRAKLQYDGWQGAVKSGKTAGTKGSQGLRMVRLALTGKNGVSGSIRYRTYVPGAGWSKIVRNGKASGSSKRAISAVQINLSGKISKYYDVYYRLYITGIGWLDWAKGGQVAGTKSTFSYATAIIVKLVKKTAQFKGKTKTPFVKNRWDALECKYRDKSGVREILEVKYTGGSSAQVVLRRKKGSTWKTVLSCGGYVGRIGIGQAREGLDRTPSGDFGITSAFGINSDPGALLPYVQVTSSMYWCGDRSYYNQLIDINYQPHDCTGEHLIDYAPHYNYGLFFDYNTNPVRYGAGSAFFVHCTGGTPYTGGCIAVSQSNMVDIIRNVNPGARLCIYSK